MYLTAVFVILFKISLGFHLNFGLAQLLHDLSGGNAQLFNIGNSKESKPTESSGELKGETALNSSISKNAGVSGNLKTSVSANSSNLEDSLIGISEKATKTLDSILETAVVNVGETIGKLNKDEVSESSLDTVSKKQGDTSDKSVLESTLITISDEVLKENKSGDSLKIGDSLSGDLKGSVETISKNVKETLDRDIVKNSAKSLTEKAFKASSGVLDNVSGKVEKITDSSNLQSPLKTLQEESREVSKVVDASSNVLKGTLKTVSGELGKTVDPDILEDAGKASKVLQSSVSESVSRNVGKTVDPDILEHAVKSLPRKASTVLQGSVSESLSDDEDEIFDSLSDKAGKIADPSILKGAAKTVFDKAGKTIQRISETGSSKIGKTLDADKIIPSGDLAGSLEIGSEEKSKSSSSGILKGSIKELKEKEGKTLQGALEGPLETVFAKEGKTIGGGVVADSLETISRKAQKASQGSLLDIYAGTTADQAGELLSGISLEDPLGRVADRVKKALNGSTSVKAQAIESIGGSLKVPEIVTGISPNLHINAEVSIGCVASSLANVPAISTFIKTCHKAVLSSKLLIILFNIRDTTALQFSRFKYRYFADVFRKLGFIDGNEIASLGVRHIAQYFEVISLDVLVTVYTSFLAFFLFSEGILVDENAEKLALEWIKAMTESSDANDVICDCDVTRKLQATSEGNENFVFSVVEMTKSKVWAMAFYYAHSWLLAAVEQGPLRVLSVK